MEEKDTSKKKQNVLLISALIAVIVVLICTIVVLLLRVDKSEKAKSEKKEYFSEYEMSGNSIEDFDLYFLQLEAQAKNKVYSPISIKYALEMLSEGADGDTKAQIDSIIGNYVSRKYPNNQHMSFANAMFIRNEKKEWIKDSYTSLLKDRYNADIVYDSFESAHTINQWVNDKTLHMIQNLLDDGEVQDPAIDYYLVNALAIDMNWNHLIQCQAGAEVPSLNYRVQYNHEKYSDYVNCISSPSSFPSLTFNGKENIKSLQVAASFNRYDIVKELGENYIRKVVDEAYREYVESSNEEYDDTYIDQYMKEIGENYKREDISSDFSFYVDKDVKVFAKDLQTYDGVTLQYVGIMPKEVALSSFVDQLDAKKVDQYIHKLKSLKLENFKDGIVTKVTGYIPVFDFDYELDLMNDLKNLGIEDVFSAEKSDLSYMSSSTPNYVSNAKHKANIQFSNEGIKASAATAIGGGMGAAVSFDYLFDVPVEVIDITFDNPFFFLIRDKDTGEVWFMGTVYEPTTK